MVKCFAFYFDASWQLRVVSVRGQQSLGNSLLPHFDSPSPLL